MTNFEKWKEKLMVADFVKLMDDNRGCYKICPLGKTCVIHCGCTKILTDWANKEATD